MRRPAVYVDRWCQAPTGSRCQLAAVGSVRHPPYVFSLLDEFNGALASRGVVRVDHGEMIELDPGDGTRLEHIIELRFGLLF